MQQNLEPGKMSNLLAIAIDFGTTRTGKLPLISAVPKSWANNCTGVAYMRPSDMTPTQLGRWPGCDNFMHKVPTVLWYHSGGNEFEWGFVAEKAGFCRSILFKTSLGIGDDEPLDQSGKSGYEMIGNYLDAVYGHIIEYLTKVQLENLEIEFSFTVPATYTDPVVEDFRRIISGTSFLKHKFNVTLTEPEAAAIHTLCNRREEDFAVSWSFDFDSGACDD